MVYLLLGCQLTLACVLLFAAIGKVVNPHQFVTALRASHIHNKLVYILAITTIVVELELAFALIVSIPHALPLIFLGAFLLLSIFTGWLFYVYHHKLHISCGCFGNSDAQINRGSVLRNAVFITLALLGLFLSLFVPSPLPSPSLYAVVINFVLMGFVFMLLGRRLVKIHKTNTLQIISQA